MSERQQWKSRLGFVLAASGSAIGLGNIVFFSANAYKFGAGAFYLPYFLALFLVGIPVMILEFGLGRYAKTSFPLALGKVGGRAGEATGWFAILNALVITMYYTTILGWVAGMWWSAFVGHLWQESVQAAAFGAAPIPNPVGSFFSLLSSWSNVGFVAFVWTLNIALISKGTKSIEGAVKFMVPLIWVVMLVFIVRGLTQPGGIHGAYLLFNPEFSVLANREVWHGAFSQIFFTLTLGFGVMTAYSSYLPERSDHVGNAIVVSLMNCAFEMIAGLAIFSLLFVYALAPKASTLSMMFFIIPEAIAQLPAGVKLAGTGFFTLLMMAGLSSSMSLLEASVSAVIDKFGWGRGRTIGLVAGFGFVGSVLFALPTVIDANLEATGTLGLTLLDLFDHYAFGYGLMLVGLLECVIVGWMMPARRLRESLNEYTGFVLPPAFDLVIKYFIPLVILFVLGSGVLSDLGLLGDDGGGLYGGDYPLGSWGFVATVAPIAWIVFAGGGAVLLATRRGSE